MKIHSPIVTGSLSVSPTLIVTGSIQGTASFASTASVAILANSSSYPFSVTGSTIYTTALGSLTNVDKNSSVFIGYNAGAGTVANDATRTTSVGYESVSGSVAADAVSIGYRAGAISFITDCAVTIGRESGYSSSFFQGNVAVGPFSGYGSIAAYSVFLGYGAGDNMRPSPSNFYSNYYSTFIGYYVGRNSISTGFYTTLIGPYAGQYSKYLQSNLSIGYGAGGYAISSSESNFIGTDSGASTYSASYSNFIGSQTGYQASSSYSILIGTGVGRSLSGTGIGNNNIIIGKNITLENGRKDSINLGGIIFATGSYAIGASNYFSQPAFSGSANGRVGINVVNPQYTLDVSGSGNYTNGLTVTGSTNLVNLTGSSALFTGAITAQTLVVQQVTSSIVYSSGSNIFGNQLTDVQQMTGSLRVTGSGNHYIVGGNVGIGTATPSSKLEVRDGNIVVSSSNDTAIQINRAGNTIAYLGDVGAGGNNAGELLLYDSAGNLKTLISSTGSRSSYISEGKVGIGTTTPTELLEVVGSSAAKAIKITTLTDHATFFEAHTNSGSVNNKVVRLQAQNQPFVGTMTDHTFDIVRNGTAVISLSGSNVGIGTTTPAFKLHVETSDQIVFLGRSTQASGYSSLRLYNDQNNALRALEIDYFGSTASGGERAEIFVTGAYPLAFGTSNTERMRITSGGAISFKGTSTGANAMATFTNDNSDLNIYASDASGTNKNIRFYYAGTSGAEAMRITSAGNVGIGTATPVSKLHVVGEGDTVMLQKSNNVPALAFSGSSSNKTVIEGGDNFNFYTANTSRMYISSSGNVGIGTTTPGYKLEVNGTTKVTGVLTQGSSQMTEYASGVQTDPVQNTWYTVYTFAEFELTAFFLMVGFENNNGDGANLTAIFVDSGTTSYGGGFSTTRLTGSTTLEAQRGTGFTLQIRTTGTAGTSTKLRWNLIRIDGE